MKATFCAIFLCILLAPSWASAQSDFKPVDEAALIPEFFSFRAQLQVAIARRDTSAVIAILHRDIQLSFGDDSGIENFKKLWQPESPESRLWETMGSVLALGGTFAADRSFTAPYVFTQWPRDLDAFEGIAVIGSGVRVRKAPNPSAEIIDSLSFTTVEIAEPPPKDATWTRVRLKGGKEGFVDSRYLRSPIDYRINFEKIDGRWQATFFIAGD